MNIKYCENSIKRIDSEWIYNYKQEKCDTWFENKENHVIAISLEHIMLRKYTLQMQLLLGWIIYVWNGDYWTKIKIT